MQINENIKKLTSWAWIAFWIIIFFPVGFFFLFRKAAREKNALIPNSKVIAAISYFLLFMGIFYLIMLLCGNVTYAEGTTNPFAGNFIILLIFIGGGAYCNLTSQKMKKAGERYQKYITIIENQKVTQIDTLASAVGVDYNTAKNDLQEMINANFFIDTYINEGSREIVSDNSYLEFNSEYEEYEEDLKENQQSYMIICPNCGAGATVSEYDVHECEYCGTSLSVTLT